MIAHDHLDLSRPRRLHLLGIGGSGMAPLARLLLAEGHALTGADARESIAVTELRQRGVPVLTGVEADVLPARAEAVLHSAALPPDAGPLRAAREVGLPVLKYARAVGQLAQHKRTLAVAGTHGKTTTTAMLSWVLHRAGLTPSCLVGGRAPQLPEHRAGGSDRLVVEACEYDRSFLHLRPQVAIVTNVEADHLDYYKDIVEITAAFRTFAAQVDGLLVVHEGLRETLARAGGVRADVVTFGPSPDADLRVLPADGGFAVGRRAFRLRVPGFHNVLNAAAVLAAARAEGVDDDVAARAFAEFEGVGRRLETRGRPRGVRIVDDYAHHPTEVRAGLDALRSRYTPGRLWVVFQPHQYSRLRRFLPEFAEALVAADRVVVPPVFAARDADEDRVAVSSEQLVDAVRHRGGDAVHLSDFDAVVDFVRTQARAGDVVVTMGAGDVGDVAGRLLETI